MPQLRKDPIIGRWVIVSTERSKKPDQFDGSSGGPAEGECPFCEGREAHTPSEISALRPRGEKNKPGWNVRVLPSVAPFLRIEGELDRRGHGLYDVMNGIGAHEIVVETPQHIDNIADLPVEQISDVFAVYQERLADLEKEQRFMESSNYNRELHNLENLLGYIGQKISYLLKELEKVIESKIASVPTDDGHCSQIPFTEWRLEKLMYEN